MPRKKVPLDPCSPYHITARSINKEAFKLPIDDVWEIYQNLLHFCSHSFDMKIINFVLMPNHFHLFVRFPKANLSQAMLYFMRESSKQISSDSGRINQVYGGPHHKSLVQTERYFKNVYRYVYQNPLRSSLVKRVEDYKYSTLRGILGLDKLVVPITEDIPFYERRLDKYIYWLNERPDIVFDGLIMSGLRKSKFDM